MAPALVSPKPTPRGFSWAVVTWENAVQHSHGDQAAIEVCTSSETRALAMYAMPPLRCLLVGKGLKSDPVPQPG